MLRKKKIYPKPLTNGTPNTINIQHQHDFHYFKFKIRFQLFIYTNKFENSSHHRDVLTHFFLKNKLNAKINRNQQKYQTKINKRGLFTLNESCIDCIFR